MIAKIFNPKIDYLEIGIKIKKPIITVMSQPSPFEILFDFLKGHFEIKNEDKTEGTFKELYVKGGLNWEIRRSTQKITFKGESFYSKKIWGQIKILVKNLDLLGCEWYLKRIDIRRSFIGDVIDPLIDLKNGFWINKSSINSFFQPELITRSSNTKSVASYFKSGFFYISVYSKSDQIADLNQKLTKMKKKESVDKIKKTIWAFKNEHKNDPAIKRFELRLLGKPKANNFIHLLRHFPNEEKFCFSVLESFYLSHPMKMRKTESNNYKQFFY